MSSKAYTIQNKKLVMYATGSVARVLTEQLSELEIAFFIDIRGDEIDNFLGYPVYTLEETRKLRINKDDYVVVITMRNVFEHNIVARQLFDLGFSSIIFKPLAILNGDSSSLIEIINNVYETLIVEKRLPDYDIPYIKNEIFDYSTNKHLININEKEVVFYIQPEILFTNYLSNSIWSIVNFSSTYILVDLYMAFEGNNDEIFEKSTQEYLQEFVLPEATKIGIKTGKVWEQITLGTRLKVYHEMNKKIALDFSFFIDNCPKVKYLKNGKFCMDSSGKNRISFLISKKFKYIPVKTSKEDYEKFMHKQSVLKLKIILEKENKHILTVPIPHPDFYQVPVYAEDYYDKWVVKIGKIISQYLLLKYKNYEFSKIRVCDNLDDWGTAGRFLQSLGCSLERINQHDKEICEQIDELFYINTSKFEKPVDNYSAILLSSKNECTMLKKYLPNVELFCFVICVNYDYRVKNLCEKNGFKNVRKMFISIWNNKIVEGFYLSKEDI